MSLTTEQAREILTACLEEEGIHDNGSVRRDLAAEHFARDFNTVDEREADDLDRVPAWFLREPFTAMRYAAYLIAGLAFVIAWLTH